MKPMNMSIHTLIFRKLIFTALPIITIAFSSCEQVIQVDLNKVDPHIVIEGTATDQLEPFSVVITKTGNYFESTANHPFVPNANVIITDDLGNSDTLREGTAGMYSSIPRRGVPGRTYHLKVIAEGKEYFASSSMPKKVIIDTVYTQQARDPEGDIGFEVDIKFQDPPGLGNYYRLKSQINSLPPDSVQGGGQSFTLYKDELTDGQQITERLHLRRTTQPGDTLTLKLCCIDWVTYDYLNTLRNILAHDQSPTSLSPTNPNTNLSNGALGYFSAYTVDTKKIILK
jgi:hypothetical protein